MPRAPVMVMAGEFWAGSTGSGLADGFRSLGWAVQDVDIERYRPASGQSLLQRGVGQISRAMGKTAFQDAVSAACRALEPDVFVTIKGTCIGRELLDQCRKLGAATVLFYPDVDFEHPGVQQETFASYDLIITTKTFHLDALRRRVGSTRVAYVPHGYAGAVHRPLFETLPDGGHVADILHAGSCSSYKAQWLTGLREALPEPRLRIVGERWSRHPSRAALGGCIEGRALTGAAYAQAVQTARINVAVHHGPTRSGWQDVVSTRTFEIPACRGFMLHIDNDEVRTFYAPGTEIDVFASLEELVSKARFYLARPELRSAMIERAYRRCVPAYSYRARAGEIAKLLRR